MVNLSGGENACQNPNYELYVFLLAESVRAWADSPAKGEGGRLFETFVHNPPRELETEADFLI
jgi:hypothetical protein